MLSLSKIAAFGVSITCILILWGCDIEFDSSPDEDKVPAPRDYVAVAAGNNFSMCLSDNLLFQSLSLWTWGNNELGQLGDSSGISRNIAEYVTYEFTSIEAGGAHALAIDTLSLWAWGDNRSGQLGDSSFEQRISPVKIGEGFTVVSGGDKHSMGIKTDGSLWAWGNNEHGQLGDGTLQNKSFPVFIGSGYASISGGNRHSLALRTDGTLWAWGDNEFGQLGDGTNTNRLIPVMIGSSFVSIAAGGYHSLAWKEDGTLWVWGHNEFGQLGDSTNLNRNAPVPVMSGGNRWSSVASAGEYHSIVLLGGEMWSCGRNDHGQVGNGTLKNQNTWFKHNQYWNAIAAGGNHSFALREVTEYPGGIGPFIYGHLYAWGANQEGQLGLGAIPTYVISPTHVGPR